MHKPLYQWMEGTVLCQSVCTFSSLDVHEGWKTSTFYLSTHSLARESSVPPQVSGGPDPRGRRRQHCTSVLVVAGAEGEDSKAASARSTSCTRRARGCGTGAYYRHPPLLAITSHPRPRSTARTYDARYRARSTCDRIGMKTDRIRTDMADIIFVFVFLLDSDSNTDNINHAG
jgi:hypothetical protein